MYAASRVTKPRTRIDWRGFLERREAKKSELPVQVGEVYQTWGLRRLPDASSNRKAHSGCMRPPSQTSAAQAGIITRRFHRSKSRQSPRGVNRRCDQNVGVRSTVEAEAGTSKKCRMCLLLPLPLQVGRQAVSFSVLPIGADIPL